MYEKICPCCSNKLRESARFCGVCGTDTAKVSNTSNNDQAPKKSTQIKRETVQKIEEILLAMLQDGDDPFLNCTELLDEFEDDFGVPKNTSLDLIERITKDFGSIKPNIDVEYNRTLAESGVSMGNTILSISVENISKKTISNIEIIFENPESRQLHILQEIRLLPSGKKKFVDASIQFRLPGKHFIGKLYIIINGLTGKKQYYANLKPIILVAENSNSVHANIFNQSIKTVGGGVVDNSSGMSASQFNSTEWVPISLRRMSDREKSVYLDEKPVELTDSDAIAVENDNKSDGICYQNNTSEYEESFTIECDTASQVDPITIDVQQNPPSQSSIEIPSELESCALVDQSSTNSDTGTHRNSERDDLSRNSEQCISDSIRDLLEIFLFLRKEGTEADGSSIILNDSNEIRHEELQQVQNIISEFNLIAICKSPVPPIQAHDRPIAELQYSVAITPVGTFLVNYAAETGYQLSSRNSFISWRDVFLQINARLMVRPEVPDIWFGNEKLLLLPGTFISYADNIPGWMKFKKHFETPVRNLIETIRASV